MIFDEDVIEHYGVKGMKWGVRKERRANKLKRTATQKKENKARRKAGKETKPGKKVGVGERARSFYDTSLTPTTFKDLVKTRSINEAQLSKADRILGRIERRKRGEASVKDNLAFYANHRLQDQLPTRKKANDYSIDVGASFAGALMFELGGAIPSVTGLGISKINEKRKD